MMSRLYYLCCDRCGIPESEGHITSADARQAAKQRGWKKRNGQDLCPKCAGTP